MTPVYLSSQRLADGQWVFWECTLWMRFDGFEEWIGDRKDFVKLGNARLWKTGIQ